MRILQIIATSFIVLSIMLMGSAFFLMHHPWVDFSILAHYKPGKPSILLDADGVEWARFQLDRREPISIKQVPSHVIQAFLAAEDRKFYEHAGISVRGIIRSICTNIYYGRAVQGASTITQQLVKLLFFDQKKTLSRKCKEQLLALITELQFTKDQILETYLNHICFGCGIYGIEAAAQRFWGKHVAQLTIDEAALLAGIIKSPARYCPLDHPAEAVARRNVILDCMHSAGYIDDHTLTQALQTTLHMTTHQDITLDAPHLKEMIRLELEELVGKHQLYTQGFIIQTTVDRKVQQAAFRIFHEYMSTFRNTIADIDGAIITLDISTGAIKALVGGYDYQESQFNRAVQASRQMGSTFKPIIYTAALAQGRSLADVRIDEPITYMHNNQLWEPHNFQKRFDGPMTLAHALIHSNNMIPIKLAFEIGLDPIIRQARACHIDASLDPYPSLALGCVDSNPLEVAAMFNIFANRGLWVKPHAIAWIKDALGAKIWKHTPQFETVFDWSLASQMGHVLALSKYHWKQVLPNQIWPDCEIMGKTGTASQARTCWFVGSTPNYTTALYIGCDDARPLGKIYAMQTALPLWLALHNSIAQAKKKFTYDPRLIETSVHERTGQQVSAEHPQALRLLIPAQ